jgi:hypothetical protein
MQLRALPKTHNWDQMSLFCIRTRNSIGHDRSHSRTKRTSRGTSNNGRTATASVYMQRGSSSRVTGLWYTHILFTTNYVCVQKTRSSHLVVPSYCTQICNFLPILEGTLSPPYFFQYNQQLWQSLHCICDGPHAYHWLDIVTMDRIHKIFRMA